MPDISIHAPVGSLRSAVVSGGNGFVGSSLIKRLISDGVVVHALANENHQRLDALLPASQIHVLKDAIAAADIVTRIQPDAIFHTAAVFREPTSAELIEQMINANLMLGATLLFAATRCAVPPAFINTGTYWQFAEDQSYSPNSLYAATKQGFQDVLTYYRNQHRIPSVTLMLYDVFGPGDDRPKLWNKITRCAPRTHIPLSAGTQRIHLVHINDVVDAFLLAAEALCAGNSLEEIYSVAADDAAPLRAILELFNERSGQELSYGWGEQPVWNGVVQSPWVGQKLPGWRARHDVIPSLVDMVSNRAAITGTVHIEGENLN